MPNARLFYGGMKRRVELSFVGLSEPLASGATAMKVVKYEWLRCRIRRFFPLCLRRFKRSLPG
jgi:hypothetical protein